MTGGKFTRRATQWRSAPRADARSDGQADGRADGKAATGGEAVPEGAPLGGTNSEAAQRLQVGLFGIGTMVLLIGLAGVLGNQADLTEEGSVPEAAATTEPTTSAAQRDPLADAGIVPDIAADPSNPAPATPRNYAPQSSDRSEPTADVVRPN